MFEGFTRQDVCTSEGVTIHAAVGGKGPPALLLHGYPQTHVCWHKIAPRLAEDFTVVASDLRGYGDSGKPPSSPDHAPYSKRAMARDQVELMHALGFERFAVVGHDRGGRVGHRMALDHLQAVERLAVLDIAPTATMYAATNRVFATAYYHWFFLIQPYDLPERMIGADPGWYLRRKLAAWSRAKSPFDPAAVEEYVRCFSAPDAVHATCEDYRAAATIDLEHDAEDEAHGRKVQAPVLALWGEHGIVGRLFDVIAAWREKALEVQGCSLPSGHFLPEEAPEETLGQLRRFLPS